MESKKFGSFILLLIMGILALSFVGLFFAPIFVLILPVIILTLILRKYLPNKIFYLLLGAFAFAIINLSTFYWSWLLFLLFMILYGVALHLTVKKSSKERRVILLSIFIIYLLIMVWPSSVSYLASRGGQLLYLKNCSCLGVEKPDFNWLGSTVGIHKELRHCVGIVSNCVCHAWNSSFGIEPGSTFGEVPCKWTETHFNS